MNGQPETTFRAVKIEINLRPQPAKRTIKGPIVNQHVNDDGYLFDFNCRPSGERGSRNTRNRHLRSSYCCSVYPAVRNSYRALLRSSSIREPSDPPLRVIIIFISEHFVHFQLVIRCSVSSNVTKPTGNQVRAMQAGGCQHHCYPQSSRQRQLSHRSRQTGTLRCLVAVSRYEQVPTFRRQHHCRRNLTGLNDQQSRTRENTIPRANVTVHHRWQTAAWRCTKAVTNRT